MPIAAVQTAATGLIPAQVAAITEGVLKSMLHTKLKTAAAAAIIVCALGGVAGTSFLDGQTTGGDSQSGGSKGRQAAPGQPPRAAQTPAQETKTTTAETKEPQPLQSDPRDIRLEKLEKMLDVLRAQNQELNAAIKGLRNEQKARPPQPAAKTEIRIYQLKNLGADEVAATIMALFDHATLNGETPGEPGAGALGGFGMGGAPNLFGGSQLGAVGGAGFGGIAGGASPVPPTPPGQIQGGGFGGGGGGGGVPRPNVASTGANAASYRLRIATIERTFTVVVRGNPDDLQLIDVLISRLEQTAPSAPPSIMEPAPARGKGKKACAGQMIA